MASKNREDRKLIWWSVYSCVQEQITVRLEILRNVQIRTEGIGKNLKFLQDNILNHDASYATAVECTCVMDDGYIPRLEGS